MSETDTEMTVNLIAIYDKSDTESLSNAEIAQLLAELKEEEE